MPLTPAQFGQTIKAKHPEYADIPDGELAAKVLAKYPQYHDMVTDLTPQQKMALARSASPTEFERERNPMFQSGFGGSVADAAREMVTSLASTPAHLVESLHDYSDSQLQQKAAQDQASKQAGHGLPYRAAAQVAPVNVPAIEHSADVGDARGIVGSVTPAVAATVAPVAAEGIAKGAPAVADVAKAGVPYVAPVAKALGKSVDVATFNRASQLWNAWKDIPAEVRARVAANKPVYPGAPLPENPGVFPGAPLPNAPSPELVQGNALREGPRLAAPDPAAQLGTVKQDVAPAAKPPIAPTAERVPVTTESPASNLPRTYSGESVLNQALTSLDNKTLLKVARSRGIDVSKEAVLKPGSADSPIIKKIINNFSEDELAEIRDRGMEASRFSPPAIDIPDSAAARDLWHVKVLQTYFPDVAIPKATLSRAEFALNQLKGKSAAAETDLVPALEESLRQAKALKSPAMRPTGTPDVPANEATWYHGTTSDFSKFSLDKASADLGTYLTTDKALATKYTSTEVHGSGGSPRIVEARVAPDKPLDMRFGHQDTAGINNIVDALAKRASALAESDNVKASFSADRAAKKLAAAKQEMARASNIEQWKSGEAKLYDASFDLADAENSALGKSYKKWSSAPLREEMQKQGYDAVRKIDDGADALVVLDPSKITIKK